MWLHVWFCCTSDPFYSYSHAPSVFHSWYYGSIHILYFMFGVKPSRLSTHTYTYIYIIYQNILFSGIKPSIFDICCSQSSIFVFRYYQGITNKSHSICLVLKQDLFQKANSHHSSIIVPYVRHVWKHNSHTHIHTYIYII